MNCVPICSCAAKVARADTVWSRIGPNGPDSPDGSGSGVCHLQLPFFGVLKILYLQVENSSA